ncbi:MAG: DUF1269 domain-containing protein [Thermomicrobiales bacterium]
MSVELGVLVFPGRRTANQVLAEVRQGQHAWIEDVAVVERNKRGRYTVHNTWTQNEDDRLGVGIGAAIGALFATVLGRAGIVAGAAVGAVGGAFVGTSFDLAEYDPRLKEVGKALEPNTSVMMLCAEPTDVDAFVAIFSANGAKLTRSSLSENQARQLTAALRSGQ